MSFEKFRVKFRSLKPKKSEDDDYVEYVPLSRKTKVYNPVEKVRQYKIKKQGYEELVDEEPGQYVRTGKPKIIRVRADGTIKRQAPPIPIQNNRPRAEKRRAPSPPHKHSESDDSEDLIDLQSKASSSSSSSEDEDPFANWVTYR